MVRRRDLLLSHVFKKETTEDIFKAAGYAVSCGAIFRFFAMAAKEQSWLTVSMLLVTFFILTTMAIIYFAKNIAIPIDNAIQPKYVSWKTRYQEMTGVKKFSEFAKQKFVELKAVYLILAMWYFFFGNEVGKLLANAVINA